MSTKKYLHSVIIALTTFVSVPVWSESSSALITIKATVNASCTLEAPSVVTLPDIPFSVLADKSQGESLPDYATTFELKSKCIGTKNYTYKFTPASPQTIKCLESTPKVLRFCLKANGQELDFQNNPHITGSDDITIVTVTPYVGITKVAGLVTSELTVTIEPS
ncbi:hypothetical protein ISU93_19885 [Enterobacter hormaechei]|uniref:hypothetical protein n=1 Tax=Enterobacter hormaechei TaxID=158836 RepID=UPI00188D72B6|nr:hypothetical protein [Enterobacter hormaechei]MBF4154932.1 hypothetical protein [Enterobacter hormaechei]